MLLLNRGRYRPRGYDGFDWQATTADTATFTAKQIREPAAATRLVWCLVWQYHTANTFTPPATITWGGNNLANIINGGAGTAVNVTLYASYVASGQVGDFVITTGGVTILRWGIAWGAFLRASATAASTLADVTAPNNLALSMTAGCKAIIGSMSVVAAGPANRANWKGLSRPHLFTERFDTNVWGSAALEEGRKTETQDVEANWDFGAFDKTVAAVWA